MAPLTFTAAVCDDPGETVAELAGAVLGTVRLAEKLVSADRHVDLAGLDEMVGVLCARALDLPREAGLRLRPKLCTLAAALDGLGDQLAARRPGA